MFQQTEKIHEIYKDYICCYLQDYEFVDAIRSIGLKPTSLFKQALRKRGTEIKFREVLKSLCLNDIPIRESTLPSYVLVDINEAKTEAPFGVDEDESSLDNPDDVMDVKEALRMFVRGDINKEGFERIIARLGITLTSKQRHMINLKEIDHTINLQALWTAFSRHKECPFSPKQAQESIRAQAEPPRDNSDLLIWQTEPSNSRRHRGKKLVDMKRQESDIINWSCDPSSKSRRPVIKVFPSLKQKSNLAHDEDLVGEPGNYMRSQRRMNYAARRKAVQESKIPIEWDTSDNSSSQVIPVMHSKLCFDDREPMKKEKSKCRVQFEADLKAPVTNPPFGTVRDLNRNVKDPVDKHLQNLENTLRWMRVQRTV